MATDSSRLACIVLFVVCLSVITGCVFNEIPVHIVLGHKTAELFESVDVDAAAAVVVVVVDGVFVVYIEIKQINEIC